MNLRRGSIAGGLFTINCPVTPIRGAAIKLKRDITIDRPLAEVFAFITDLRNDPSWNTAVAEMNLLTPDAPSLGARYRQAGPGPLGERMYQQVEVTEYELDRKLSFRASGPPFPFLASYTFERVNTGTRVLLEGRMEVHAALFLLSPLIKGAVSGQIDAAFMQLKLLLEGQPAVAAATETAA